MTWTDLTEEERQGMTREYFDALTPEAQKALAADVCLEEGCQMPRWREAGSFRCEQHTRQHSSQVLQEQQQGWT